MTFVQQIASVVTVLHEGRLLCQGTIHGVKTIRVVEVYLGQHKTEKATHEPHRQHAACQQGNAVLSGAAQHVEN